MCDWDKYMSMTKKLKLNCKRHRIRNKNIVRLSKIFTKESKKDTQKFTFSYFEPIVFHEYEQPEDVYIKQCKEEKKYN